MTTKIEKPPARTDGSDFHSYHGVTVSRQVYRLDSKGASFGQLRLIHDDTLAACVLQKAVDEVSRHPSKLPLAAFRCAQWVRRGRMGYRSTWDRLFDAARNTGSSEAWIRRCLYHSFALANVSEHPTAELAMLARGVE